MMMRFFKKRDNSFIGVAIIFGLFATLSALTACNNKIQEVKTENQEKNEAYMERIAKDKSYTKLLYPGSIYYCYYKQLKAPTDPNKKPLQNSSVLVRYVGKMINGEIFDGEQYLVAFQPGNEGTDLPEPVKMTLYSGKDLNASTIEGFQIALQHMGVGEKVEVVIPWQLAYGAQEVNIIKPYSTLIFYIELVKILND